MNHPVMVVPAAMEALQTLSKAVGKTGVPFATLKMVELRASQINGCSFCVDMHSRELRKAGESEERIATVAAWREAPGSATPSGPPLPSPRRSPGSPTAPSR